MPDQPRKHDPKAMSGEVDRLLRQLNPDAYAPVRAVTPAGPAPAALPPALSRTGQHGSRSGRSAHVRPTIPRPGFMRRGRRTLAPPAGSQTTPPLALPSRSGVWFRAILGVSLAGALTQWPYALCGFSLAAYLAAVTVALVAGGWAGHASWRRRMGVAHVVAIAVIFTGAALAALQVLPRVGYAAAHIAWRCVG